MFKKEKDPKLKKEKPTFCKSCGNEILTPTKFCTNCGAKIKKTIYKKKRFWAFIILIFMGMVGGSSDNDKTTEVVDTTANIEVTNSVTTEEITNSIYYALSTEEFANLTNILSESFYTFSVSEEGKWIYTIESYIVDNKDIVEYENTKYIDPEGYLQPGIEIYWIEDNAMCNICKIKDIGYNREINGTVYPYALNVEFYDDPYSSGWRDGYSFLRANKDFCGKPAYYIKLVDENRRIQKESIDFDGNTDWTSLSNIRANKLNGLEVYMGKNGTKTYIFKIITADKANDTLFVEYPSGSTELKSYKAITKNESLYVKSEPVKKSL